MRSLFLWLGVVGGAIPTLAQAPATVVSVAGTGAVHDVVLVTAALVDEPGSRLPVTADVIEREEIVARQATAVADLLRSVAGLDVGLHLAQGRWWIIRLGRRRAGVG